MIFDTHMHTELSTDSDMKITEVIKKSENLGIGVSITEHLDLNYIEPDEFRVNPQEIFDQYSKYKSNKLLLGIEMGLSSSILEENKKIASSYPFDIIIGSVHSVLDKDIYLTYSKEPRKKEDYFNIYFENMIQFIKEFDNFDTLGHIDYPCRYCNYENNEFTIEEHGDYLREVFKLLLSKDKVLEINTRRLSIPHVKNSLVPVYKLYKSLGGKYITLGSDAHTPDAIGVNFDIAKSLCMDLSLTPVYFKNRKHQIITL